MSEPRDATDRFPSGYSRCGRCMTRTLYVLLTHVQDALGYRLRVCDRCLEPDDRRLVGGRHA